MGCFVCSVVSSVGCAIGSVGNAVGNAVSSVGSAVGSVAQGIGNIGGQIVQGAICNPLQTAADIAAISTGNGYLVPLINAGSAAIAGSPTNPRTPSRTAGPQQVAGGSKTIPAGGTNVNPAVANALASALNATPASSGALPGSLNATELTSTQTTPTDPTAGVDNVTKDQLVQLYPQLANTDPNILNTLRGRGPSDMLGPLSQNMYGSTPLLGTNLVRPNPGIPSMALSGANSANQNISLSGQPLAMQNSYGLLTGQNQLAKGGQPHKPEFITGDTGHYVQGAGDGQSDDIPAMLADGEYVFDADTVSALGNGSNKAGADFLDRFREAIRDHKRSAPNDKIPPKAAPLEYVKRAMKGGPV